MYHDKLFSDRQNSQFLRLPRTILIGSVLCVVLNSLAVRSYAIFNRYSGFADHFNTVGLIFLIFWVAVLCLGLRAFRTTLSLTSGEFAVIYAMLMVATALPTMGFGGYFLPLVAGVRYYASPENGWPTLLWQNLPEWIAPKDEEAIRWLFEGMPVGAAIPWGTWMPCCFWWGTFMLAFFLVSLGLMSLVHRQWAERERLIYPLATVPLCLADGVESPRQSLFTSKLFWCGFAIAGGVALYNFSVGFFDLHGMFATLNLRQRLTVPRVGLSTSIALDFLVLGLSYLLTLDVLFSIWFFHAAAMVERGIFNVFAIGTGMPTQPHAAGGALLASQQTGALLSFVLASLWIGRHFLKEKLKQTLRPARDGEWELMPARGALLCVVLGAAYMGAFIHATGLSTPWTAVFLLLALCLFFGTSRLLAQTGIGRLRAPCATAPMFASVFGTNAVGHSGLGALGLTFVWAGDIQLFAMGTAAHALKVCGQKAARPRSLLTAMLIAFVVGLMTVFAAYLWLGYHYGLVHGYGWYFVSSPKYHWGWVANSMRTPIEPQWKGIGFMGGGALAAAVVSFAYYRLPAFPLHPVGMAIAMTNTVRIDWSSMFLAWLVKLLIVHFGGFALYRRILPLFLGFILGSCVGVGFNALMGAFIQV